MSPVQSAAKRAEATLRKFALGYPEAYEEFPWGERVVKVKGKVFVFLGAGEEGLSIGTKLPHSNGAALMFPFAEPTHYGLGKSGWVTAKFAPREEPPLEILQAWIDESYRAVAPKKLVAQLATPAVEPGGGARPAASRPAASRPRRRTGRKQS